MLQSMGSQRIGHDLVPEQQQCGDEVSGMGVILGSYDQILIFS